MRRAVLLFMNQVINAFLLKEFFFFRLEPSKLRNKDKGYWGASQPTISMTCLAFKLDFCFFCFDKREAQF